MNFSFEWRSHPPLQEIPDAAFAFGLAAQDHQHECGFYCHMPYGEGPHA